MKAESTATVEQVVLLDEAGRSCGSAVKSEVHDGSTPLHLAFSCWIVDDDDRVLLTRRASGKTFEGVWTNAVCGHPAPGEALVAAVRRRCEDELGVTVSDVRLMLPEYRYRAEQDGIVENELCPVVLARVPRGTDVSARPAEVSDHEWLDWQQVRDEVLDGRRTLSLWAGEQIGLLAALGDQPSTWTAGDPQRLPPAYPR